MGEIKTKYGVSTRQWVLGTQLTEVDLAVGAARKALAQARIDPSAIDLLVLATSTPSRCTSSSASAVAKRLGSRAASFDVRAGGAGGLIAWHQAACTISGTDQVALVIATETVSPWLALDRPGIQAALFGDGAAALVIRSHSGPRHFQSQTLDLAGQAFTVPAPLPPQPGAETRAFRFQTPDQDYVRAMHAERCRLAQSLAAASAPINAFFPFAPTLGSQVSQAQAAGLDPTKVHTCLAEWGAPGAAAPLIALADYLGAPNPASSTLAFSAVGGGVHSAALSLTIEPPLAP